MQESDNAKMPPPPTAPADDEALSKQEKVNIELTEGKYSVRVYVYHVDQWIHLESIDHEVGNDSWRFAYQTCPK